MFIKESEEEEEPEVAKNLNLRKKTCLFWKKWLDFKDPEDINKHSADDNNKTSFSKEELKKKRILYLAA